MRKVETALVDRDFLCAEIGARPAGLVVFGASGDLVSRKLLTSFYSLFKRGLITEKFYVLGVGRTKMTDEEFRDKAEKAITGAFEGTGKLKEFCDRLYYAAGDYGDEKFYYEIGEKLKELDKRYKADEVTVFYMAIPPVIYETVVLMLGKSGLSCVKKLDNRRNTRIVVEKPFGRDLASAQALNRTLMECFDESQVYRIDHYLGKETVQNILIFRFANTIFEPFWNRNYIDSVQITIAENLGIEHRAGYYEKSGAMRDMFQNHMLSMLALVAMEPPASFDADSVRDEKVKLIRSVRPFDEESWKKYVVRAQYGKGEINGAEVPGYREEKGVDPDSMTETYVAMRFLIDNWRWKDVPFYLRTGKRLAAKDTEIVVKFKSIPHSMFAKVGLTDMPANELVFQIQPSEGISLSFEAKRPGSKLCMGTLQMQFNYSDIFKAKPRDAYERLLLDCLTGDQMLFTRADDVHLSWELLMPIIKGWENGESELHNYPAGAESFAAAESLIVAEGRKWRPLVSS